MFLAKTIKNLISGQLNEVLNENKRGVNGVKKRRKY